MVKHLLTMQETWVRFMDCEYPLEEGMATHSSTLAWEISWTEEAVGYSPLHCKAVGHNLATKQNNIMTYSF